MDINKMASSCDMMVISTGSIGSGVSIENKLMSQHSDYRPFDVVFAFGYAGDGVSPLREWIQGLSRPRDMVIYFICIQGGSSTDRYLNLNYSTVQDEIDAGNLRQDLLFKKRESLEQFKLAEMQAYSYAIDMIKRYPEKVEACSYDREKMVACGLLPDKEFRKNINFVEEEMIQSASSFRSDFVKRALKDGHRLYTLETNENPNFAEYTPPNRLPDL